MEFILRLLVILAKLDIIQIMTIMIRTFIAIELPDEARTALTDLQHRLKAIVPTHSVRWTAPAHLHLTLHFLGNVVEADIGKIGEALTGVAANYPPFSLSLGGLGCFPNLRRPRIVWIGVLGDVAILTKLYRQLGQKLSETINFTPDTRPYSPHLTIGRVKDGLSSTHLAQLGQLLEREQVAAQLATLPVGEISLIKSDLKPTGPVYTKLHGSTLSNHPEITLPRPVIRD